MRNISKIIVLLNLFESGFSEDGSFFMTVDESNNILEMISKKKSSDNDKKPETDFKISGIFYIDTDNWTVWINDIAYSSIGQQKNFSIDEVSENYVVLTMNDGVTLNLSINSSEDSDKVNQKSSSKILEKNINN